MLSIIRSKSKSETIYLNKFSCDHLENIFTAVSGSDKLGCVHKLRGQRVKDFIDIYFLLETYSIGEMIGFYKKKYSQYNEANVLKSLCWFEEVDLSDWPVLFKTPKLRWGIVKKTIKEATSAYLNENPFDQCHLCSIVISVPE